MRTFEHLQYNQVPRPATLPAWRYESSDYGSAVYGKTALGLWTLEGVVGTTAFRRAMAAYLAEYRFKHPTGADFRAVLERSLGDQSWFFDDYMNGTGVIEYVAGPIETTATDSIAQVRRTGEVRAPVEVRVTLADGSQDVKSWDGQKAETIFTFPAGNPVTRVEVDPEDKLKAEKDRDNNIMSARP
jgi:aminopeptidase N